MKYIVFITENVKCKTKGNNRILVGVHATENAEIFDGYLGDGVYVNQSNSFMYPKTPFQCAVKKYGVDSFKRTILQIFDTYNDAYTLEHKLVSNDFVDQSHTYNTQIEEELNFRVSPLYQFDIFGNLVRIWDHPEEAMNVYGYPITKFYNACKYKMSLVNSFWAVENEINANEYKDVKTHNFITYIYNKDGKLLKEFWNYSDCAKFIGCEINDILNAIKNQVFINGYFILNYTCDLFTPRPRVQYVRQTFHVYDTMTNEYLGAYKGKSVMKVINQHSWAKISKIFSDNRGYYKHWYLSLEQVDKIPERVYIPTKIEVYTRHGRYIETLNSVKEMKDKYDVPNARIKRIQQGNKYFGDYIFKYSK